MNQNTTNSYMRCHIRSNMRDYARVPSVLFNICALASPAREEATATKEILLSSSIADAGDVQDDLYSVRVAASSACPAPRGPRFYAVPQAKRHGLTSSALCGGSRLQSDGLARRGRVGECSAGVASSLASTDGTQPSLAPGRAHAGRGARGDTDGAA